MKNTVTPSCTNAGNYFQGPSIRQVLCPRNATGADGSLVYIRTRRQLDVTLDLALGSGRMAPILSVSADGSRGRHPQTHCQTPSSQGPLGIYAPNLQ